jgi:hypothetical protein
MSLENYDPNMVFAASCILTPWPVLVDDLASQTFQQSLRVVSSPAVVNASILLAGMPRIPWICLR